MRFILLASLCLTSLASLAAAELGYVTELTGVTASKNCDLSKNSNVKNYIANGQYALVSRTYFESTTIAAPGYMCGAAVIVVNKEFANNTVQFSNIAIVDVCETCAEFDIQLGPNAFNKVSGGLTTFLAEWGRYA